MSGLKIGAPPTVAALPKKSSAPTSPMKAEQKIKLNEDKARSLAVLNLIDDKCKDLGGAVASGAQQAVALATVANSRTREASIGLDDIARISPAI